MIDNQSIGMIVTNLWHSVETAIQQKPAEYLTAFFLFFGLVLQIKDRQKRVIIEIISYKTGNQDNILRELDFRVINKSRANSIYIRTVGATTFNTLIVGQNESYAEKTGYRKPIQSGEDVLLPGKSIRDEIYEWKNHGSTGIAYIYVIDQTGKQWKQYIDIKSRIKYYFLGMEKYLNKLWQRKNNIGL